MGMGRKAPVVNSVEVIGLWLSFPNNNIYTLHQRALFGHKLHREKFWEKAPWVRTPNWREVMREDYLPPCIRMIGYRPRPGVFLHICTCVRHSVCESLEDM